MNLDNLWLAISLAAFEAESGETFAHYMARIRRDPATPEWARVMSLHGQLHRSHSEVRHNMTSEVRRPRLGFSVYIYWHRRWWSGYFRSPGMLVHYADDLNFRWCLRVGPIVVLRWKW
jgi:hypothetical protein